MLKDTITIYGIVTDSTAIITSAANSITIYGNS